MRTEDILLQMAEDIRAIKLIDRQRYEMQVEEFNRKKKVRAEIAAECNCDKERGYVCGNCKRKKKAAPVCQSRDEAIKKITIGLMCAGEKPKWANAIAQEIAALLGYGGTSE